MKPTSKKLDKNVIRALTEACETAKMWRSGFQWLTHTADYSNFPTSLVVTCVFDTEQQMANAVSIELDKTLRQLIQSHLLNVGINLKKIHRHVRLDSEESCIKQDKGNWDKRIERWSM